MTLKSEGQWCRCRPWNGSGADDTDDDDDHDDDLVAEFAKRQEEAHPGQQEITAEKPAT